MTMQAHHVLSHLDHTCSEVFSALVKLKDWGMVNHIDSDIDSDQNTQVQRSPHELSKSVTSHSTSGETRPAQEQEKSLEDRVLCVDGHLVGGEPERDHREPSQPASRQTASSQSVPSQSVPNSNTGLHKSLLRTHQGQYLVDIEADRVCFEYLLQSGFGILSEESGLCEADREVLVVIDPIDGSTNAAAGLAWFSTSLCAVDEHGPWVAVVANHATGQYWWAIRGHGAFYKARAHRSLMHHAQLAQQPLPTGFQHLETAEAALSSPAGTDSSVGGTVNSAAGTDRAGDTEYGLVAGSERLASNNTTLLEEALVCVSGLPTSNFGWNQFRSYGAASLDLCHVAQGSFDAFADLSVDAHGVWDYLAGLLICQESDAKIKDGHSRDLILRDPQARRTPIAACTESLLDAVCAASWPMSFNNA